MDDEIFAKLVDAVPDLQKKDAASIFRDAIVAVNSSETEKLKAEAKKKNAERLEMAFKWGGLTVTVIVAILSGAFVLKQTQTQGDSALALKRVEVEAQSALKKQELEAQLTLKQEELRAQFKLKAVEIVMQSPTAQGAISKAKALKALFPELPEAFVSFDTNVLTAVNHYPEKIEMLKILQSAGMQATNLLLHWKHLSPEYDLAGNALFFPGETTAE